MTSCYDKFVLFVWVVAGHQVLLLIQRVVNFNRGVAMVFINDSSNDYVFSWSTVVLMALMLAMVGSGLGCAVVPGQQSERHGDEIVVAGQFFRIGTPVVTWMDPGGYDAYRVEARFADFAESDWDSIKDDLPSWGSPNRYSGRINRFNNGTPDFTPEQIEQVRGGGWTLEQVQEVVDQFVLHYDVCGTSARCFMVLHDLRCLSVHFMLDVDGTIYQTLDLKERAWHAGTSNSRSVGIEIANMGAYGLKGENPFDTWYGKDENGNTILTIPERWYELLRVPGVYRPIRNDPVIGSIQGGNLQMYDLTPEQYDALGKLTASLVRIFPKMKLEYPKDADGNLIPKALDEESLAAFQGLIGHYHITSDKVDPGPAFDWERVVTDAERHLDRIAPWERPAHLK